MERGIIEAMGDTDRQELGRRGERSALAYLESLGYRLLSKNFRNRNGEADLILTDQDTLVFCEVKTRRVGLAGSAAESYRSAQRKRLVKLALRYLQRTGWNGPVRFDLLALQQEDSGEFYRLEHLKDVLETDELWS